MDADLSLDELFSMMKEEKDLTHCERICEILCETAVTELDNLKLIQPKIVKVV